MTYFDHAATTPLASEVLEEMMPFLTAAYGNPSSIHSLGQEAKCALDVARDRVAGLLHAQAREIVFTSGGTEADNLAIRGSLWQNENKGRHLVVSSIEHEAVLDTAESMRVLGWDVTLLPVDRAAVVQPDALKDAMRPDTTLVSVMTANNEVGTIQPIAELAAIAHEAGALFHTDAVQAIGAIDVAPNEMGVDLLSLSGHKLYGPKGIGALWVRHGMRLAVQMTGGGQERERRSGTENVAAIVGLGKACEMAAEGLLNGAPGRLSALRDHLISGLMSAVPGAVLTGHPSRRLPGSASFLFPWVEGEAILLNLDFEGFCVSSGSACSAGAIEPSHVLLAMGFSPDDARGALRLTLGRDNTEADVDRLLGVLPGIVQRLRDLRPGG
ncbi:MAG TPA: cysteine desulfurase family protein [Armatimonadota bacterium]|jgi:cysteine desulfurase